MTTNDLQACADDPTTRVLVPAGMLGSGFPTHTIERGISLGAHVIAIDGGSTDSGPYYLGTASPKTTEEAVHRDLDVLVPAALGAGIPLVVGSCGTCGADAGVDWIAGIIERIAAARDLHPRIARIYSEQDPAVLQDRLTAGRIAPLDPAGPLDAATISACEHVVGLMGHHPIAAAVEQGAQIVLAGRATDTAVLSAVPLLRGCPPGPTWHAAKIAECGGMCTVNPRSGGVLLTIDADGFTVEPLDPATACTPRSVAAHMMYENADPFRMREPDGTLDASDATYLALDDRRVRVTGSRFTHQRLTMKLEGSAVAGYRTMSLVGIRDPHIVAAMDTWVETFDTFVNDRIRQVLRLAPEEYSLELRCYGWNAVLGSREPADVPAREVGVVLTATANDQATATRIAKFANPYLLHLPLPGMDHLPSFAFAASPPEMPCGAMYEFRLQHAVELDGPLDLVRTVIGDL